MLAMWSRGMALVHAGRAASALEQFDRILEIDPMFRAAIDGQGMALFLLDRLDEAAETLERIVHMTGDAYKGLAPRGYVAARRGRRDEAYRMIEMLHERSRRNPELALEVDFMIVYAGLRDFDLAIEYLKKAAEQRLGEVVSVPTSFIWKEFWDQPRVREVYEQLGLAHLGRTSSVPT
jgi:tetratricopeptide (TPR) repeat protein